MSLLASDESEGNATIQFRKKRKARLNLIDQV
jgi:hypothetical protein